MKINGVDHNSWLYPIERRGNLLEDTVAICKILEDDGNGVDAFHISSGSTFPHPRNPPGDFPVQDAVRWYDGLLSSGVRTHFNYAIFRNPVLGALFQRYWRFRRGKVIEGINTEYARFVRARVGVPVLCTGGFQRANVIAEAIRSGACDAVTIARPLIANRDLPQILQTKNEPAQPCTYCNKCLLNDLENPLGCYELSRFQGKTFEQKYDNMMRQVMSVFKPSPEEPRPGSSTSSKPEVQP
jgi:2,4-dienoyl-CoA reductase (NADPH2)